MQRIWVQEQRIAIVEMAPPGKACPLSFDPGMALFFWVAQQRF